MKRKITVCLVTLVLLGTEAWCGTDGDRPKEPLCPVTATDQLKQTLGQLIDVLNDPSLKTEGKETQRAAALHDVLKQRFDEDAFARKALGRYWKTITPGERETFAPLFTALLERTYFERIDAELERKGSFTHQDIRYLKESTKGNSAQVTTVIKSDAEDGIPVIYRLGRRKGTWWVIDMKIEGVIISKNYRAQFHEILARNPMSKLIEKLQDKLGIEQQPADKAAP